MGVFSGDLISPHHKSRFLSKVYASGDCLLWGGNVINSGYGQFSYGKYKKITSHRASYLYFIGDDLTSKDIVMHSCDNKLCVNPKHLSKGTQLQNIQDCIKKNRKVSPCKMSKNDKEDCFKLFLSGKTKDELAKKYNVSRGWISQIIKNKREAL